MSAERGRLSSVIRSVRNKVYLFAVADTERRRVAARGKHGKRYSVPLRSLDAVKFSRLGITFLYTVAQNGKIFVVSVRDIEPRKPDNVPIPRRSARKFEVFAVHQNAVRR